MVVESVLLIMSKGYVYFLTNFQRTTLYIGFTSNLTRRIWEHKQGKGSEFTSKYNINRSSRDESREREPKKYGRRNGKSRSRSKSPLEPRKTSKPKLKLVDY